jgi:hypothetical protein
MGEVLRFDLNAFNIGDLEDFEEVVGRSLFEVFPPGKEAAEVAVPTKAIKALVWIVKRQADPDFTLDDARSVKISGLEIKVSDQEESPTDAAS